MNSLFKYIIALLVSFTVGTMAAQDLESNESVKFTIRGSVIESDTREPIKNVNIEVNGGSYTTTDLFGDFRIEARRGDELTIRHKDFETVYHVIENNDRIIVEVEPSEEQFKKKRKTVRKVLKFNALIDSADAYLKKDAKKSIQFVTNALEVSKSTKENGEAFEALGDIYMYWKQFDLAVSNYRISEQNRKANEVKLKLASAYRENKNYQESIEVYNSINKRELSNWQLVSLYEGQGDVYQQIGQFEASIKSYNEGLRVAEKHVITPKVTDLNSKLADAYNASGNREEASGFYSNSLKLAKRENKRRSLEQKVKVADFQNKIQSYDEEIQLREAALSDINEIEYDSVFDKTSAFTSQKQKYKIGNAYAQQQDFEKAISFLEESIEEADDKEDLVVQKDATRRLSEVYRDAEDFKKAFTVYQDYVRLVDTLYAKREQEISQSARFRKDIANKQNRIESLESDRELSQSKYQLTEEQSKRQKLIIYSLFGGVLFLLVVSVLMYKFIRQQRFANNLLALKSLRSQMNPHFIFNALNSVNSFIAENDERTANRYLTDFSLLMRAVLENSEEDFIPLKKEIELLQLYTKLEHFRFRDKFDYSIKIDQNINVNEFQIPPMLLQPYIENAVWHGLRYKESKGSLLITIQQKNDNEINIIITDDGIGRKKSEALKTEHQQKQNSKGMGNIKKRVSILNEMYKDKVDVSIDDFQDENDTGTKVIVTLKRD